MCIAAPQTAQYDPFSGRSACRQVSQTGRRETRSIGEPQIRQSAGKKVKNKVAAAHSAKPANPCSANPWSAKSWSAAWPWAARIRNPVLLKTASALNQSDTLGWATLRQYSRGAVPMQRDCRTWKDLAFDSVISCLRAERVRVPESCARRSCVEGNAHTELFAATKAEAHASRRSREGESETLLARHIPGSGIPRKIAPKRQEESENVSWTELS